MFEDVSYYLVERKTNDPSEVKKLLKAGGASREYYPSDLVTHVISDSPLEASVAVGFPTGAIIVQSDWVTTSVKCGVILPTPPFELREDRLFSHLVFCTSKLPRSDVEKLCVLLAYHGGRLQRRMDSTVTHLVTMEMAGPKCEQAARHSVSIVTPDWLLDCIDCEKRLQEADYHPSCLQYLQGGGEGEGYGEEEEDGDEEEPVTSPANSGESSTKVECETSLIVTSGKVRNIRLASRARRRSGVGRQRRGKGKRALSNTLRGNAAEDGILESGLVSPKPVPVTPELPTTTQSVLLLDRGTLPEEENARSQVPDPENTTQSANDVAETAVGDQDGQVGPDETATEQQAPPPGPQPEAASASRASPEKTPVERRELLKGIVLCFIDYQDCTDSETLDAWKEVVVQHGGVVTEEYDPTHCTHVMSLHKRSKAFEKAYSDGKCIASAHWLNDVLTEQKMFPPRHALHFPMAFRQQVPEAESYCLTLTNYTDSERDLVKDMVRATGIPYTGYLSRETTHLICKSPEGKKYEKAIEWGIEAVNASFLSDIIHNGQVPAVLLPKYTKLGSPDEFSSSCYEALRLLKPWEEFMSQYCGEHPEEWVDVEASQTALQPVTQGKRRRNEEEEEEEVQAKKPRLSGGVESVDGTSSTDRRENARVPVVVFTGLSQSVAKKLKQVVLSLGGRVTEKPRECSHIVSPKVSRTVKFLSGISVCDHVVTPEWVEQCDRSKAFVEESSYILRDHDVETMFSMDIPTSLTRAKSKKLLEGLCLCSTPGVMPPSGSLKEIVECAGGELLTHAELKSRFGRKYERLSEPSSPKLLVLSCDDDVDHGYCTEFFHHNIGVYNAELVLTGVLRQELDYTVNSISPD